MRPRRLAQPASKGSGQDPQRRIELRARARRATTLLAREYGSPNHNNKNDPLDELVFIILSQMTTFQSFERVYARLKASVPRWDDLLLIPLRTLKRTIKDAGLSNQKAPRLKAIFARLKRDFGSVSLEPLRAMSDLQAEEYLVSLPGVQRKTAKCVLMYSLGREVLPVDTHVLRVARRLGLTTAASICDAAHASLEDVISPRFRYDFHVNAISHGRTICLAKVPRCGSCILNRICPYPEALSHPRTIG